MFVLILPNNQRIFTRNIDYCLSFLRHFGDFQTLLPMVGQQQKWFYVYLRSKLRNTFWKKNFKLRFQVEQKIQFDNQTFFQAENFACKIVVRRDATSDKGNLDSFLQGTQYFIYIYFTYRRNTNTVTIWYFTTSCITYTKTPTISEV